MWRYQDVGPWGQLRLRPRHAVTALTRWGTWEVEWRHGSHDPAVPAPQPAEPAWLTPDDHQWHPLVLPRGRQADVVRAAAAELRASTSPR
ncbi:hypothetical protein [Saccharopolyspora taberi]|uniref:Uncharacterized protein n=1 Tax=Saccharopolyspora taberi TaxID=60895 RepID=A0ABN3V8A5_9PSEU